MKTIEVKVYEFDELSEKAKPKARDWYLGVSDDCGFAFEDAVADAEAVGLHIESLGGRGSNIGSFITSAPECAESTLANHGEGCGSYITARAYYAALEEIGLSCDAEDGTEERTIWETLRKRIDNDFLEALLKSYASMYAEDCEYRQSNEFVEDMLRANGYTFTEDGRRFG